jgi:hypothetical protein
MMSIAHGDGEAWLRHVDAGEATVTKVVTEIRVLLQRGGTAARCTPG